MTRNRSTSAGYKIGDTVEIPNVPAAMIRLPDGTVVTARGTYTARHAGNHAIVISKDGKLSEKPFTVVDPTTKADAKDGADE